MSRGRLKPEDENCIQENYVYLKKELEALDIVDYLYQQKVLNLDDKEKIYKASTSKSERNEILLGALLNTGPGEAFNHFLRSLECHYQHVISQLNRTIKYEEVTEEQKKLLFKFNEIQDRNTMLKDDIEKLRQNNEDTKLNLSNDLQKALDDLDKVNKENGNLRKENDNLLAEIKKCENEKKIFQSQDLLHVNDKCHKNPSHIKFIPIKAFQMCHLPQIPYIRDLYQFIKIIADLTVFIELCITSESRPQFYPGTDTSYPLYKLRGKRRKRESSGFIYKLKKFTTSACFNLKQQRKSCQCAKCKQSGKPSTSWAEIFLLTTTSAVFDNTEGRATKVTLFYDDDDKSETVTLDNLSVLESDIVKDCCCLTCTTCDEDLIVRLESDLKFVENFLSKDSSRTVNDELNMVSIVSHPHGCSKQVSIGQWIAKYTVTESESKLTYNACTCPGSLGAFVYRFGNSQIKQNYPHLHSGALNDGINYSTVGVSSSK